MNCLAAYNPNHYLGIPLGQLITLLCMLCLCWVMPVASLIWRGKRRPERQIVRAVWRRSVRTYYWVTIALAVSAFPIDWFGGNAQGNIMILICLTLLGLPAGLFGMSKFVLHTPSPNICQVCGYDIRGNVSKRCPECGNAVKNEEPYSELRNVG